MTSLTSIARQLNAQAPRRVAGLPALFFVTDATRTDDPCAIAARLPKGSGILFRHYAERSRPQLARQLAAIARRRKLILIIAADPELARAVRAHGVHWPEMLAIKIRPTPDRLVTAAAHSARAIVQARRLGADAVFVSPIFPTRSSSLRRPLGPLRLAALARQAQIPVYALGGISAQTARRLKGSGVAGLAAVDAFLALAT